MFYFSFEIFREVSAEVWIANVMWFGVCPLFIFMLKHLKTVCEGTYVCSINGENTVCIDKSKIGDDMSDGTNEND